MSVLRKINWVTIMEIRVISPSGIVVADAPCD